MIKAVCKKCRYLNVMHRIVFTGGGKLNVSCRKCGTQVTFQLPMTVPIDIPKAGDLPENITSELRDA